MFSSEIELSENTNIGNVSSLELPRWAPQKPIYHKIFNWLALISLMNIVSSRIMKVFK